MASEPAIRLSAAQRPAQARPRRIGLAIAGCTICSALIVVSASPPFLRGEFDTGVGDIAQGRQATLDELLQRVGTYVRQFEADFSVVLGDEEYEQKDVLRTVATYGNYRRFETSGRVLPQ